MKCFLQRINVFGSFLFTQLSDPVSFSYRPLMNDLNNFLQNPDTTALRKEFLSVSFDGNRHILNPEVRSVPVSV